MYKRSNHGRIACRLPNKTSFGFTATHNACTHASRVGEIVPEPYTYRKKQSCKAKFLLSASSYHARDGSQVAKDMGSPGDQSI